MAIAAGLASRGHVEETWWFYSDPPKKMPPAPLPGSPVTPQPDRQFLDCWLARQKPGQPLRTGRDGPL